MDLQARTYEEDVFVPEVPISSITKKDMLAKISIARSQRPGQICGVAKRIGFTGRQDSDLAIYRLKILRQNSHNLLTLPAFFVVVDGKFMDYDAWRQTLSIEQSVGNR